MAEEMLSFVVTIPKSTLEDLALNMEGLEGLEGLEDDDAASALFAAGLSAELLSAEPLSAEPLSAEPLAAGFSACFAFLRDSDG